MDLPVPAFPHRATDNGDRTSPLLYPARADRTTGALPGVALRVYEDSRDPLVCQINGVGHISGGPHDPAGPGDAIAIGLKAAR